MGRREARARGRRQLTIGLKRCEGGLGTPAPDARFAGCSRGWGGWTGRDGRAREEVVSFERAHRHAAALVPCEDLSDGLGYALGASEVRLLSRVLLGILHRGRPRPRRGQVALRLLHRAHRSTRHARPRVPPASEIHASAVGHHTSAGRRREESLKEVARISQPSVPARVTARAWPRRRVLREKTASARVGVYWYW